MKFDDVCKRVTEGSVTISKSESDRIKNIVSSDERKALTKNYDKLIKKVRGNVVTGGKLDIEDLRKLVEINDKLKGKQYEV